MTTQLQLINIIIIINLPLQKVIQSIKMVPSGIKIGKEQPNVLAYADDIALIGKNEIEIRKLFVEMENITRKLGLQINLRVNEDNNNQIDLQERIKNANKTHFILQNFLKIKTYQRN